jgi:epoxyqueuosine reductase
MQRADTIWIVDRAKSLGFDLCGVARVDKFPEIEWSAEWLARGYAGEMKYLADPRRSDLQTVLPGSRTAIVCLLNYNTEHSLSTDTVLQSGDQEPCGWISRYAWGDDYHEVLRERLDALVELARKRYPQPFEARAYVDTGPLHERVLAKYAGLGWLGKNTLLLNHLLGSFFFLGVVLTTLDLEPTLVTNELPPPDLCGNCRQCLDACPTQAFVEPYVLDPRKCISYLTIELRGSIPEELREPMNNHVFGCDICQDVCPWNRRAPISPIQAFQPRMLHPLNHDQPDPTDLYQDDYLFLPRLESLASMGETEFQNAFRSSPIKRTKWRGLIRNACNALGNSLPTRGTATHTRITVLLARLASSPDSVIAESARWALLRIQ